MIADALIFFRKELLRFLKANESELRIPYNDNAVVVGNVAALEAQDGPELEDRIVLTLVNLEEESSLKNGPRFIKNPSNNTIEYITRPVFLNLYILFTAPPLNARDSNPPYENALRRIAAVVQFFQSKKSFTSLNSPESLPELNELDLAEFRLFPELYTLTFEQINHLWGSLGGRQVPFVMYKIRLVPIQGRVSSEAPVIEEIREDSEEQFAKELDRLDREKAQRAEQLGEEA